MRKCSRDCELVAALDLRLRSRWISISTRGERTRMLEGAGNVPACFEGALECWIFTQEGAGLALRCSGAPHCGAAAAPQRESGREPAGAFGAAFFAFGALRALHF